MTFCIGIRVRDGLVALSDTLVVKGSEVSMKAKLTTVTVGRCEAVLMTSGLRSVRDKVVARLGDELDGTDTSHTRLHEFASSYGATLRTVRSEDEPALSAAGLTFDSHAILGGRFDDDPDPVLMHVYPEGNWVEATEDAPYFVIGRSSYGKPVLDRLLTYESTLAQAVSLAYLAFDATRASANDVDFPIDVAVLTAERHTFTSERFADEQLAEIHEAWHDRLRLALDELPTRWAGELFDPDASDESDTGGNSDTGDNSDTADGSGIVDGSDTSDRSAIADPSDRTQ